MGLDSDQPLEDLPPIDAPTVDACSADLDAPLKESVSEEAEARAFLRALRADRNETLAREGIIAASVAMTLICAAWIGDRNSPELVSRALVADAAGLAAPLDTAQVDSVRIGPPAPPTIEGNLGRAVVMGAVERKDALLRRCFEMGLERDPHLSGDVTMKILVGESGAVIGVADIGSTVRDRGVVHCVARSMRTLDLPAPAGGRALVTYPFDVSRLH